MTPAGVVAQLHTFTGEGDGAYPSSGLVLAGDGNFYGTTFGLSDLPGTVYRITPDGTLKTIKLFPVQRPRSLILGSDGNLALERHMVHRALLDGCAVRIRLGNSADIPILKRP